MRLRAALFLVALLPGAVATTPSDARKFLIDPGRAVNA